MPKCRAEQICEQPNQALQERRKLERKVQDEPRTWRLRWAFGPSLHLFLLLFLACSLPKETDFLAEDAHIRHASTSMKGIDGRHNKSGQ